jgi:RimJ/RimL family protein N-acetyltransferase
MIIDLFEEEDSIICTGRLALRLMKEEDAADIFEIRGDWDTASDAGVPCMKSIEEARDYIQGWYEDSVVIVLGDEVIGLIESYTDDELLYDSTFLGYYMKKNHRNKGYMTEALIALRERLKESGDEIPMLWMYPGNDASARVATKSGWTYLDSHVVDIDGFNQYVEFWD